MYSGLTETPAVRTEKWTPFLRIYYKSTRTIFTPRSTSECTDVPVPDAKSCLKLLCNTRVGGRCLVGPPADGKSFGRLNCGCAHTEV